MFVNYFQCDKRKKNSKWKKRLQLLLKNHQFCFDKFNENELSVIILLIKSWIKSYSPNPNLFNNQESKTWILIYEYV